MYPGDAEDRGATPILTVRQHSRTEIAQPAPTPQETARRLAQGGSVPDGRFLRGVLEDLNDLTGDPDRATAELQFLLETTAGDHDAMKRYVKLTRAADGRTGEALREAHRQLERTQDETLHQAYLGLLKAARDPERALKDLQSLPQQDAGTVKEFTRHLRNAGDASPDEVRKSFRQATKGQPQTPPHLAKAQDTLTRLTGSAEAAKAEMQWVLQSAPQTLDSYVELVKAADGVQLQAARELHAAPADLRPALLDLLQACKRSADTTLAEFRWLQQQNHATPREVHGYASLVRTAGEVGADRLHQLWTNLNGASRQDIEELLRSGALRAPELRDTQRRLAEILGPEEATRELDALLLKNPKDGALDRFVDLVERADGRDMSAVGAAFDRLEAHPELRDAYHADLEVCDRSAATVNRRLQALAHVKDAGQRAEALELHTLATRLTGDASDELFTAVEVLRSVPEAEKAVRRLPELLKRGVPPQEAARDLEVLHRQGGTSDDAFETLLDLREEALPDAHQGVRDALAFFLRTPEGDARHEQAKTFQELVRIEGDPAEALQDLQWLVAGGTDASEYLTLLQQTDAAGRPPVRKALQELHATPDKTPAPGFLQRILGRHVNRDTAFRRLYEMEGGRADHALQDLKTLERMLGPDETLGHALKEMERLFRMPEATRPEAVRETFAQIRQAPAEARAALRQDITGWAEILGELDLGRRAVAVFRRAVDPEDFQKRGEMLAAWRDSEGTDVAVDLLEAVDGARAPGQPMVELADTVKTLRETKAAGLTVAILRQTAKDAKRPGAPFRTRQEAVTHFLTLYRTAKSDGALQAAPAFLEGRERTGTWHERTRVLSALANGLQDLAGGMQEYAELEKALPQETMLAAAAAYGDLLSTLAGAGVRNPRQQARELMAWAGEHAPACASTTGASKTRATVAEMLQMLSAQFLLGATVEGAKTAVLEKFQPAREVAVEDEFVEIGGVRVPRRRGNP